MVSSDTVLSLVEAADSEGVLEARGLFEEYAASLGCTDGSDFGISPWIPPGLPGRYFWNWHWIDRSYDA